MRALRWVLLSLVIVAGLMACSDSPKAAHVSDVVEGRPIAADPSRFSASLRSDAIVIEATVTDVRPGDDLLVELSDGRNTIWVSGFKEPPQRASTVLTALVGAAQPNDKLGAVYPSSGALDPNEVISGFSEKGALSVLVGVALALVLVLPAAALFFGRVRGGRNCPECRRRQAPTWQTCPYCGRAQDLPQGVSPHAQTQDPPEPAPDVPVPPPPDDVGSAPAPVARPTRIVRGD